MTKWSLTAAVDAFARNFPDEPRNVYRKAPDALREAMPAIAEDILAFEPEHSNDYYLDATVIDIVGLLPLVIAADANEIFVARTPTLEPNAEAEALGEYARVAYVYQGLSTALTFYAYLQRRIVQLMLSLDRSAVRTSGNVIRMAAAQLPRLLEDRDIALVLERRKQWAQGEEVDIDDEIVAVLERYDDRLSSGSVAINQLHDLGEHFVVGHEMAHHLLGHLQRRPFEYRSHPAATALLEARQRLQVTRTDDGWNDAQVQEFDADAFAFLTLAGEIQAPGTFDHRRWYAALIGSLLALPALEDLALAAAAASDGVEARRVVAETHPPVGDRISQILEFAKRFPRSGDDALVMPHPDGLIVQALVYWRFLTASR